MSRTEQRANVLMGDIMKQPEMLSSDQMAKRLGVTRDTVNRRQEEGKLLALNGTKRGFRCPGWQLDQQGKPVVGLEQILKAAGDPWNAYRWLTSTYSELGDISGLDALQKGKVCIRKMVFH